MTNATPRFDPTDPLAFFHAAAAVFAAVLAQDLPPAALVDALLHQALDTFETNVAAQCEGQAELACRGGCAACCALRVTATAPEILGVAAHLRVISLAMPPMGLILRQRIAAAADLAGQGEAEHMAMGRPCAFIVDGHCVIYEVRPLACRGHASFDEAACVAAIAGEDAEVPISEPHHLLRAYVQNALQSALRDAGLPWAIHEFVPALALALANDAASAWAKAEDRLAPTQAADVSLAEMAATFDTLKALPKKAPAEAP